MTRRLPPKTLNVNESQYLTHHRLVADIFTNAEQWEPAAAHAALYRFRPDLRRGPETEAEILAHQAHMIAWPSCPNYFARVCRLLAVYGVGGNW